MIARLVAFVALLCVASVGTVGQTARAPRAGVDWPGFRGIGASGVSEGKPVAVSWSVPDGKLVKWRVAVAGLGHSSPVIWGDTLCTSTAVSGTPDPQL